MKCYIKTKATATLKLADAFRSYLFEQEFGELEKCTTVQIKALNDALNVLDSIIIKNKIGK